MNERRRVYGRTYLVLGRCYDVPPAEVVEESSPGIIALSALIGQFHNPVQLFGDAMTVGSVITVQWMTPLSFVFLTVDFNDDSQTPCCALVQHIQ